MAEMLNKESGVDVKDRKWRFKKYRQCFVGRECVVSFFETTIVATNKIGHC